MRFGKRMRGRNRNGAHPGWGKSCRRCPRLADRPTLADVPPGCRARVAGFCPDLPADRLAYLQAYGLSPGRWVRVLRHLPVTLVQVEHTELAMETELACEIEVTTF